ncbi:hypothetical protein LTR56_019261 [Elasticomyces elasticus]|nr:hypothetical protein LTR56_019261 [Elasticomyces elasticus]KAK4911440.1 hypothetical protein LTR49_020012 [Elasticomyces elasticus]KAK5755733.1 hypothetical protein LTS12_014195 [Elasticomyces elasticus]
MTLEGYEQYEPRVGIILKGFADENVVTLHEDQPEVIDQMIEYIYKNDYKDNESDTDPKVFNVRMVAVAEKYFVDNLAQLAIDKLVDRLNEVAGSDGWAEAIEVAYATTTDSDLKLRDNLFRFVIGRVDDLLDPDQSEHSKFQAMAARTPRFTLELAIRLASIQRRQRSLATYRCPGSDCSVAFQTVVKVGELLGWNCRECGESAVHNHQIWQAYRVEVVEDDEIGAYTYDPESV